MQTYRHTQIGWTLLFLLGALVLGFSLGLTRSLAFSVPILLCLAVVPLFGALTVTVHADGITAAFGLGLIRRRVRFADVRGYALVRNHWLSGYGIRWLPHGWLWNVSGLDAVEVQLDHGRVWRIGTDEPQALADAIGQSAPQVPRASAGLTPSGSAPWVWLGITAAIVLLVGGLLVVEAQPVDVRVDDHRVEVDGLLFDASVPHEAITRIELLDALPRIRSRTWGYSDGWRLRGWFMVEGWGQGQIFIDRSHPPFVTVHHTTGFLVVSAPDAAATRALYKRLEAYGHHQP